MIPTRFSRLCFLLLLVSLAGCHSHDSGPIWDVPAVIGQPIDVAIRRLGPPQSQSTVTTTIGQTVWRHEGRTLTATWKTGSRRVTAWTLQDRDEANAVREEEKDKLLVAAQLKENDPRYSLEWIEARERPLFYTGVTAVPAPKNHNTVLRVTGSSALLQVSYQATGPQAKSESFMTVAPWETTLQLPDDSAVTLTVELRKNLGGPAFNMKCEILEDGVVKATQSSTGPTIQCNYEF